MNLHIVQDSVFVKNFYEYTPFKSKNRFVANTVQKPTKLPEEIPFAKFGSKEFDDLVGELSQYDHIFLHYLSDANCQIAIKAPDQTKISWMFWGSDFYGNINYPLHDQETIQLIRKRYDFGFSSLKKLLVYFLRRPIRKKAIAKLSFVCHYNRYEYELVKSYFDTKAKYQEFFYPNEVNWNDIHSIISFNNEKSFSSNNILLGNSGTPSNNHASILNFLTREEFEQYNVIVPLSYGNHAYIDKISIKGRTLLGNRFRPIYEFLPSEKYVHILNSVDHAIFNTFRGQAVGTMIALLSLGKVVYLNQKSLFYCFCLGEGIYIRALGNLLNNPSIIKTDINLEQKTANYNKVFSLFSEERAFQLITRICNGN